MHPKAVAGTLGMRLELRQTQGEYAKHKMAKHVKTNFYFSSEPKHTHKYEQL